MVLTCAQLHRRAERVATLILEKGKRNVGDHVALVYPPSIDLVAAFYGCLYVGCVPIVIRPPHPHNLATTLPTLKMIVEASNSTCILTNSSIIKSLRSKVCIYSCFHICKIVETANCSSQLNLLCLFIGLQPVLNP